jgi:hypothetical protein
MSASNFLMSLLSMETPNRATPDMGTSLEMTLYDLISHRRAIVKPLNLASDRGPRSVRGTIRQKRLSAAPGLSAAAAAQRATTERADRGMAGTALHLWSSRCL